MNYQIELKKNYKYIQSGKYRGKKILLAPLRSTRATKNIVKNCVFNVIRTDLRNKIFIEAFGGSALMAAEALSNDALRAYAIELDVKAYKIALENAKNLDARLRIIHANCFKFLPKLIKNSKHEIILYMDPPFNIRKGFADIYERIDDFLQGLELDTIYAIILEYHSSVKTPQNIQNFQKVKEKKFGFTRLSFYRST